MEDRLEIIIKKAGNHLGYANIKPEQLKVVIKGQDCFILPTGYGKSLCFALPLVFNVLRSTSSSIVIVVTPLISIMQSMVEEYRSRGLKAGCISMDVKDAQIKDEITLGNYSLVFFTPEAILNPSWRSVLLSKPYQDNLVAFVIDEAHTVYKWLVQLHVNTY